MRRTLTVALVVAAALSALGGCGRREGAAADGSAAEDVSAVRVVGEINSFTDELVGRVEASADRAAGVAEARRLLDARKASLAASIAALKRSERFRGDAEARRQWLEAEVGNTERVSGLRSKYFDAAMADAAFKEQLDRLVSDYQELFRD